MLLAELYSVFLFLKTVLLTIKKKEKLILKIIHEGVHEALA